MTDILSLATFAPHIGEVFRLRLEPERTLDFELVAAKSLGAPERPGSDGAVPREPFSLIFKGPANVRLQQRIYRFEHEAIAQQDIFIVPVGIENGRLLYEAIFG